MPDTSILENKCNNVNEEIKRLNNGFKNKIGNSPSVIYQLAKTENRSLEFKNGTFIVLVVGPVKSGKSTLVNLIANAYVSPTHFLECTVRPSIISKHHGEDACKITVFTSNNTTDRVEQIDAIIDTIRGIEKEESLENIQKDVFDLTPENIKEKVELGLKESLSSETLVTSITTPGGKLMKQDVFIVDMPGFDGEYANIDDPVYDTIAQRADLIIFVQSSNSAISKVSGQFLKKLSKNNQDVPVCLIHNVFDSSWWRSHEERTAAILKQKEFAIKEIRKQGFNIHENQCFSINLGKVEDCRKQTYSEIPVLQNEGEEFDRIEDKLYDRIINRRDAMRLNVNLSRTRQQLNKTIHSIDEELIRRTTLLGYYEQVQTTFDNTNYMPNFPAGISTLAADYPTLKSIIRDEAKSKIELINPDNNHRTDTEATGIVLNYIDACENSISASFRSSLSLNITEQQLFSICKSKMNDIINVFINCKNNLPNCKANPIPIPHNILSIDKIPVISLLPGIDFHALIPRKRVIDILIERYGGHSATDIVSYINKAAECLAGSPSGATGYIEKQAGAIEPILNKISSVIEEMMKKYEEICNNYWEQSRQALLHDIIADKTSFDTETEQLNNLRQELFKIQEQI